MSAPDLDPASQQKTVQQLLGRCLLLVQAYEQLLKRVLAHHHIEGPAANLASVLAGRIDERRTRTLGTLAKELFEGYVVPNDPRTDEQDDDPGAALGRGGQVRLLNRVEMTPERYDVAKAAVDERVVMRNDLVHHLIEMFDISTADGCLAARHHLEDCHRQIDVHLDRLRQMAQAMDNARALMASMMQSEAFADLVDNGIAPDGTIDWPHAGIVACLREAATARDAEGWCRLNEAIAFVEARYPEQTPAKYACRTWPHVLNESRAFDIAYRCGEGGPRTAWYRERP